MTKQGFALLSLPFSPRLHEWALWQSSPETPPPLSYFSACPASSRVGHKIFLLAPLSTDFSNNSSWPILFVFLPKVHFYLTF